MNLVVYSDIILCLLKNCMVDTKDSYRIRLPQRVVKRELDVFAKENKMMRALIERSFFPDILKRRYWLSVDYRRKMLVW